jgi:hypothetical protein
LTIAPEKPNFCVIVRVSQSALCNTPMPPAEPPEKRTWPKSYHFLFFFVCMNREGGSPQILYKVLRCNQFTSNGDSESFKLQKIGPRYSGSPSSIFCSSPGRRLFAIQPSLLCHGDLHDSVSMLCCDPVPVKKGLHAAMLGCWSLFRIKFPHFPVLSPGRRAPASLQVELPLAVTELAGEDFLFFETHIIQIHKGLLICIPFINDSHSQPMAIEVRSLCIPFQRAVLQPDSQINVIGQLPYLCLPQGGRGRLAKGGGKASSLIFCRALRDRTGLPMDRPHPCNMSGPLSPPSSSYVSPWQPVQ